ncbi:MAG: transposase [Phycisphaerae bacterium]|nr:transposase [Phycisphaerae bacterium]
MGRDRRYHIWYHDNEGCGAVIGSGARFDVELTGYGSNDFVLDFLVGSGLWGVLTSMRPDGLRKENGRPWRALNGVEVLRELARVERIGHCGKIVRDVGLMLIAGFNAEAVHRAHGQSRGVVTPETLSNPLGRISPRSAAETFCEQIGWMRRKRWIRGKTYVADAHEIIVPYGRRFERLGKVGEKHGYKLVMLLNATADRERVVGFVLAPLHHGERSLLRIILRGLQERFGRVGDWMGTLILDRGYWGGEYLLGLHRRYGIDVVTRAQHEGLDWARDVQGLAGDPETAWRWRRESHSRLGEMEVRCAGLEGVALTDDRGVPIGSLNGVVAEEYTPERKRLRDENGRERPVFVYATTLPTAEKPERIRDYYRMRWVIENQGFRELTQQWALDRLAGRRFNTLNSRIAFAFMLYNAERVLRMKHPGPWQSERRRLRDMGHRSLLGGPSVAVYTREGALGLYTPAEYGQLIAERERNRIVSTLRQGLARGDSLERLLDRLHDNPPRKA